MTKPKDGPQTRAAILAVLAERKGLYKSEMRRATGVGWGTLWHHIPKLEETGKVVTEVRGRLLWLFHPTTSKYEREFIIASKAPIAKRLMAALGLRQHATIRALSEELTVSKKVIRAHLGPLKRAGAVEKLPGHPPTYASIKR